MFKVVRQGGEWDQMGRFREREGVGKGEMSEGRKRRKLTPAIVL